MKLRIIGVAGLVALLGALAPTGMAAADDEPDGDSFEGVIESLPGTSDFVGDWLVSGTVVHVTTSTVIEQDDGAVAVGASVEVEGTTGSDASITAVQIEVEEESDDDAFGELEFEGFIQSLPGTSAFVGDWLVNGTVVHVTTSTEIEQDDGAVALGAAVEVKGLAESDSSVTASEIEVKHEDDIDEDSMCLTGTVTAVPNTADHTGTWRVSRHAVRVDASARIVHEGRLSRGSTVRVFGVFRPNGSIRAERVVVRN